MQPLNSEPLSITDEVSILGKSNDTNEEYPLNIVSIIFNDEVSKFDIKI
jgi:hypothetical protein